VSRDPDSFESTYRPARASAAATPERPWLGVRFVCAGAYLRVYRNASGTAYNATCPRCGKCIRFAVGSGGVNQRFFEVRC
jgi:hypothetical protein